MRSLLQQRGAKTNYRFPCLLAPQGGAQHPTFAPGSSKVAAGDFSGGSVVESEPADAGDTGRIPDTGGSHTLQGNKVPVPQLFACIISPGAATAGLVCWDY